MESEMKNYLITMKSFTTMMNLQDIGTAIGPHIRNIANLSTISTPEVADDDDNVGLTVEVDSTFKDYLNQ